MCKLLHLRDICSHISRSTVYIHSGDIVSKRACINWEYLWGRVRAKVLRSYKPPILPTAAECAAISAPARSVSGAECHDRQFMDCYNVTIA